MVEIVVWSGTRWESEGDECVCLSEKKRKESKMREREMTSQPYKSEGVCEMWWVVIGLGGACGTPKNIRPCIFFFFNWVGLLQYIYIYIYI